MDRNGTKRLLKRILSSQGRVVLLTGPAASGKTSTALAMVQHFLNDDGRGRCVLLVPNAPAVAAARRAMLAGSATGVIVAPQVSTFAALAERILVAAGNKSRTLSAFRRSLLLQHIVAEMASAEKFSALAAVSDTPGLVIALDRVISQLKRAAVEPEALAAVIDKRQGKLRDLTEVYRRFQTHLRKTDTYDIEGRMWLARDTLAALPKPAPVPGLEGVGAIVVDGFTDFTPTQLKILTLLSPRLQRILVTLPFAGDGRVRMWHWSSLAIESIRKAFGKELEEIAIEPQSCPPPGALWRKVFDMDAEPCQVPAGFTITSAAGVEAEAAAVARRVKRLLLDGSQAGSIAVLARSMASYRPVIERIFALHDIPVAPAPQPLADIPIVRFILDTASLKPDFAFADVLRVIKNSYFRPQALGDFDAATVATAEMLIRTANVLGGRKAYAEAAKRLARRDPSWQPVERKDDEIPLGPLPASPKVLAEAADMLERLFELIEMAVTAPKNAKNNSPRKAFRGLAGGLNVLIEGLDLRVAARDHEDTMLIARDVRGLAELDHALGELDEQPPPDRLRRALSEVFCAPARTESLVDVIDVLDA
ncbi:MAG: hypothetical protein SVT52_02130, partial [Planctomycetota bacterium]|nr:hypothetical protein [Planctomycetota bacterium]